LKGLRLQNVVVSINTSIEYSFLVTVDALERMEPRLMRDEEGFLGAFDAHRDLIFQTAAAGIPGIERAAMSWFVPISGSFVRTKSKFA